MPANTPMLSDEEQQQIIKDYRARMTLPEVAKKHGIGVTTVVRCLERNGEPRRRRGRPCGPRPHRVSA